MSPTRTLDGPGAELESSVQLECLDKVTRQQIMILSRRDLNCLGQGANSQPGIEIRVTCASFQVLFALALEMEFRASASASTSASGASVNVTSAQALPCLATVGLGVAGQVAVECQWRVRTCQAESENLES